MRGMQKRALTGTDVPASKARTSSSTGKALVRWGWVSVFLLGSAQATECSSCAPSLVGRVNKLMVQLRVLLVCAVAGKARRR